MLQTDWKHFASKLFSNYFWYKNNQNKVSRNPCLSLLINVPAGTIKSLVMVFHSITHSFPIRKLFHFSILEFWLPSSEPAQFQHGFQQWMTLSWGWQALALGVEHFTYAILTELWKTCSSTSIQNLSIPELLAARELVKLLGPCG